MWNRILLISLISLSFYGCAPKNPEYFAFTQQYKTISGETCDSLIASIKDEIAKPATTEAEKIAYNNLIERLQYIKDGAIVINEYASKDEDLEMRAKVLHLLWQINAK